MSGYDDDVGCTAEQWLREREDEEERHADASGRERTAFSARVSAGSDTVPSGSARRDEVDESATVTTQTHRRSILERAMMSSEYARARQRDRMRFQDLRARLFGLARTFDPDNRLTVCRLVKTLGAEYLASLYDMSYRAFRFFDAASVQACSALPTALAVGAVVSCDGRGATVDWLTRRTVENFCRVHFYRAYEYLRCHELQRIILPEAFDRDDYSDYVTELFMRQSERLERERATTMARHWTEAAAATAPPRSTTEELVAAVRSASRVVRCLRATERSLRDLSGGGDDDDNGGRDDARISSLDLVVAAAIQRDARHRRRGSGAEVQRLVERTARAEWPSWNQTLSRLDASLAKARAAGSVDERVDVLSLEREWSYLSAESYDYMELYRRNARRDRRAIRGDGDFYANVFATLFRAMYDK